MICFENPGAPCCQKSGFRPSFTFSSRSFLDPSGSVFFLVARVHLPVCFPFASRFFPDTRCDVSVFVFVCRAPFFYFVLRGWRKPRRNLMGCVRLPLRRRPPLFAAASAEIGPLMVWANPPSRYLPVTFPFTSRKT